ncbi:hypothetical protein VCHC02A1_2536 [Vibrio cholerae HC-02A1]|nr:hypothetical protein VCHC02A1_2536 [Vibrio cholerae HC-02A1]
MEISFFRCCNDSNRYLLNSLNSMSKTAGAVQYSGFLVNVL